MKNASIIKAKYLRSQDFAKFTKLWDNVSETDRNDVLKEVRLIIEEQIILFCYVEASYWWLITNQRLILFENDLRYLDFKDIKKIELSEIFSGKKTKSECATIDIYTSKKMFQLIVEKGTWHSIYGILKFLIEVPDSADL